MAWNKSNGEAASSPLQRGSRSGDKRRGRRFPDMYLVVLGVCLALGGGGVWFFVSDKGGCDVTHPAERTKRRIEGKRSDTTEKVRERRTATPSAIAESKDRKPLDILTNHPPIAIRRCSTNAFVMGAGPHAFRNGTEQLICRVFCCPLGTMPMPLPTLPEQDMKRILKVLTDQNPINEDDDDDIKEQKEILEQSRLEMAKYVVEGGDPNEFLRFYHKQLMDAYSYRQIAISEMNRIKEEEHDPELARQMLEKVNEKLKADGIILLSEQEFGGLDDED